MGGLIGRSTLHTRQLAIDLSWLGKTFGVLAVHNWTLTPHGGMCVRVQESLESWLVQLLQFYFRLVLRPADFRFGWLSNLKRMAETLAKRGA